ncbi:MAG: NERD domain-containing protein [Kiritimatiellae bacterium]|nr:NERD domain-containing protein [Kiritimatiellia bacterium]
MAEVHGVAGEWARVKGTVAGLWPLFAGVFALGFSSAVAAFVNLEAGAVAVAASLAWIGCSVYKGARHVERYFKGARGEERVAGILKSLPAQYHVFNDFVACGVHVDHVVAGPAGVYAVETKYWRGVVTIEDGHILLDGQLPSRSPLAQVRKEAALVKSALEKAGWKGDVTPVLAFASDTFSAHVAEVQGAVVINSCDLRNSFETDRVVIAQPELDRLVRLMESNS